MVLGPLYSSVAMPITTDSGRFEMCDLLVILPLLVENSTSATAGESEGDVLYGQPDRHGGWPARGRLHFEHTGLLLVLTVLVRAL